MISTSRFRPTQPQKGKTNKKKNKKNMKIKTGRDDRFKCREPFEITWNNHTRTQKTIYGGTHPKRTIIKIKKEGGDCPTWTPMSISFAGLKTYFFLNPGTTKE